MVVIEKSIRCSYRVTCRKEFARFLLHSDQLGTHRNQVSVRRLNLPLFFFGKGYLCVVLRGYTNKNKEKVVI